MEISAVGKILLLANGNDEDKKTLDKLIISDNLEGKSIINTEIRIRKTSLTQEVKKFAFIPYYVNGTFIWFKKAIFTQRLIIINMRENYDEFGQYWWHSARIKWINEHIQKL